MELYRVRWTNADGERQTSVASYDLRSAETVKQQKEDAGLTDVEIIEDTERGRGRIVRHMTEHTEGFWTEERMRSAKPAPMPRDRGR